jgi:hypothetical protein
MILSFLRLASEALTLEVFLLTGTEMITDSEQNDIMTAPFFDQLQGAKIVDKSHDQDTTDLHKCISFITKNPPGPENSNVLKIN